MTASVDHAYIKLDIQRRELRMPKRGKRQHREIWAAQVQGQGTLCGLPEFCGPSTRFLQISPVWWDIEIMSHLLLQGLHTKWEAGL